MKNQEKIKNTSRNVLLIVLALLGIGAIFGGGILIISPSGKLLGMPLSMLDYSPFRDFLIPGIILFTILGLAPVGVTLALIKKPEFKFAERFNFFRDMHWAWSYCIYIAFALIIWIQVETIYVQSVGWLQTFYLFYAIPIIFTALLPQVRGYYKK